MAPERLHVCHRHKLRIPRCSVKGFVMQIGASAGFSAQWQTLENAAKGNYQDSQDFDAVLQMMNDSTSTAGSGSSGGDSINTGASSAGSTASGDQNSGKLQMRALVAVGTRSSDGQMTPYSTQQLQSEKAEMNKEGASVYADALQNFMTFSQANGQAATAAAMSDPSQFMTGLGSGIVYESVPDGECDRSSGWSASHLACFESNGMAQ
jgi:hypothetical protein